MAGNIGQQRRVQKPRGRPVTSTQIGSLQGADHLLLGSRSIMGDNVQIAGELGGFFILTDHLAD